MFDAEHTKDTTGTTHTAPQWEIRPQFLHIADAVRQVGIK